MKDEYEQEPVETREGDTHDRTSRFDHPAFAQIAAHRFTCTPAMPLYGSDFGHHHAVSITIRRSQLNRNLSHDWHFGREELIEVHLSEAQWASFVSSMNSGDGVPCTINHLERKRVPRFPLRRTEDVVRKELATTLRGVEADVDAAIADIEGILISTIEPAASQRARTLAIAAGSVPSGGVRMHQRPWNSSAKPAPGPECSVPAIG